MSNDDTTGLTGAIQRLGGTINTMMPMPQQSASDYDKERTDHLIRGNERLSTQVAHLAVAIDKLSLKMDKLEAANISRREYEEMKERTDKNTNRLQAHHIWLILLTIGGCLIGGGLLYLFVYVFSGGL